MEQEVQASGEREGIGWFKLVEWTANPQRMAFHFSEISGELGQFGETGGTMLGGGCLQVWVLHPQGAPQVRLWFLETEYWAAGLCTPIPMSSVPGWCGRPRCSLLVLLPLLFSLITVLVFPLGTHRPWVAVHLVCVRLATHLSPELGVDMWSQLGCSALSHPPLGHSDWFWEINWSNESQSWTFCGHS